MFNDFLHEVSPTAANGSPSLQANCCIPAGGQAHASQFGTKTNPRRLAMRPWLLLLILALLGSRASVAAPRRLHFDVVVYGATPSGIVASVAASRQGLRVALVEPTQYIGGMVTGGLSYTDRGNVATIGGIPREFFSRVGEKYGDPVVWGFEPHVAEEVFQQMLQDAKVDVFLGMRLREHNGVTKKGTRIVSIKMEDGTTFSGAEFADAGYEGDLMAQAGVSAAWGRESRAQYGESLAGVLPTERLDLQFRVKVSPYGPHGKLLPLVSSLPRGEYGAGDKRIPSYNYRLCLTSDKADQIPYPKPTDYDPQRFALLARYLPALEKSIGRPLNIHDVLLLEKLKNNKWDANNQGAISTDYIGMNWTYPTASYKEREKIALEHKLYDEAFFYFLAHDPQVPPALQAEVNQYGLAKDEFRDTDNWPHQLYIREARRMLGQYVFTQHDVLESGKQADSIGMGSYQLDSHNIQRVPTEDGAVENEGDYYVVTKPYEIPYRSLTPKASEVVNLLVPVCISSTHAAYGTIRQEPVYMILGQATGTALAIAVQKNVAVQDVPVSELQSRLLANHAVLHWSLPSN